MIGQTLLHYRITDRLGAGGMGEVYLARDEKLNRDVALKVLPEGALSDDRARIRFRKEADALSRLSHPHIATIHDFDTADGVDFLVMELVRGPSLRDEIEEKGALPEGTVVRLGAQLARALQAAHEQGIVHRDLKPSNLQLTEDGLLKVLDFGLARLLPKAAHPGNEPAATQTAIGRVAGTLPYMSPEQVRGQELDARTDLYAAGAVLYEMTTGRRPFSRSNAAELTAAILNEEPTPPRVVNDRISPGLEAVILKALDKDPELRCQTAKDLRVDLERLQLRSSSDAGEAGVPRASREREPRTRERLAWAIAALAIGATALLAWRGPNRTPEERPLVRFGVDVPAGFPFHNVAVSPDGRHVAFSALEPGPAGIWVRSLESHEGRPLPVPDDAIQPFWSPDSRSLAFFTKNSLHRLRLADGVVEMICGVPPGWLQEFQGGTWAGDTILFSAGERLLTVPESGGEPKPVEPPKPQGASAFLWPDLLPDGRRFLYTVDWPREGGREVWLSSLDRPEESTLILPGVSYARYARSGHLLFVQGGTLLAQPFDLIGGAAVGEPSVVASPVATTPGLFSASPTGVLVYSEEESAGSELTWFDRGGARVGTMGEPGRYTQIQLSPDGRRVAAQIIGEDGQEGNIWTLDVRRGVPTRVTSSPGLDSNPVWSPDGQTLFFVSGSGRNALRLHRRRLDGSGPASLVHDPSVDGWSEAVSPDGATLLYLRRSETSSGIGNDSLWAAPLDTPGDPELLLTVKEGVEEPQVSPDGRWLLYGGRDSGSWEVYLAPFRREGERVRVSTSGGRQPKWRGDGREVFYVTPRGQLMAVDVKESNGRPEFGLPEPLFNAGVSSSFLDQYAVTNDGQRFLVITPFFEGGAQSFQVVLNWPELLE